MIQHFNIGKKEELNPFEKVKFVKLGSCTHGTESLHRMLNKRSDSVTTVKIDDNWVILYDVKYLDFDTIIQWYDNTRGKFQVKCKHSRTHSVHFLIEDNLITIW